MYDISFPFYFLLLCPFAYLISDIVLLFGNQSSYSTFKWNIHQMFICSDNSWYSWITRPVIVSYCIESGCDTDESTISWFNIKISSYQYRKSHCGDKTVVLLNRGPVFEPKISRRAGYEVPVVIILENFFPNHKMELQFILFVSTNITLLTELRICHKMSSP